MVKDLSKKTREQLVLEIQELEKKVASLQKADAGRLCVEEALRESEEKYRDLIEGTYDMVQSVKSDGTFFYANRAWFETMGYEKSEISDLTLFDVIHPDSIDHCKSLFDKVIHEGESQRNLRAIFVTKYQKNIFVEGTAVPRMKHGEVIGTHGFFRDITGEIQIEKDRSKLEEQLSQSQKMEAIGQLAGGVAHDINNVLGSIMAAASLLETDIAENDSMFQDVADILAACRRGRGLTGNLLGFARKGKYVKEKFFLNDVIEETKTILERTLLKKTHVETVLEENSFQVEGDRGQIKQALMNICINARDAMFGRGVFTIATENIVIDESKRATLLGLEPGQYVQVQVTDTGIGMEKDMLAHIFEPFYTTKPSGRGTGLGLSMVYGTIKNHGGFIDVDSEPGAGTTVTLIIPAFRADVVVPFSLKSVRKSAEKDSVSILLVDDEDLFRNAGQRVLERLGYDVVTAKDGQEALAIYRDIHEQISLVILDMIMPIMDGNETFDKLIAFDPDVKILISSGYAKDENVEALLANGASDFLQKPFDMGQIDRKIIDLIGT